MGPANIKSILDHFHPGITITLNELIQIENFLFNEQYNIDTIDDPEIIETMEFLKESIIDYSLSTVFDLMEYCNKNKQFYTSFIEDLHEQISICQQNEIQINSTLSDYFLSANDNILINTLFSPLNELESVGIKNRFSDYLEILLNYYQHLHVKNLRIEFAMLKEHKINLYIKNETSVAFKLPSYLIPQKNVWVRYLEEFADVTDHPMLICWKSENSIHPNPTNIIDLKINNSKRWTNNIYNRFLTPCCIFDDQENAEYDYILSLLKKEEPIRNEEIRSKILNWLLYYKSTNTQQILHHFNQIEQYQIHPYSNIHWHSENNCYCSESNQHHDQSNAIYKSSLELRKWIILKSPPDHTWLTSDNPGFGINLLELKGDIDDLMPDANLTKVRRDTLIYFPLSSNYCLRIQPDTAEPYQKSYNNDVIEFQQSSQEELEMVNGFTFSTRKSAVIGKDKKIFEQLEMF